MSEPAPELPVDLESETPARRAARLAWERARLDEAFDDIAHGRVISGQAALDWLDRWAAGEDVSADSTD
jgi:predicted transcriptional regulator